MINESKKDQAHVQAVEEDCLARLRLKFNCDAKEAKKPKPGVEVEDLDSDHEADWVTMV